ncbi:MAG: minor capsid protein [Eubacterium sp.]|nr:minor capsid protein [Eubacterium sp.]
MPKKITPSRNYWRQREEEQRKKNLEDQKEYDERIKSIYQKAMDNIQKEIDSFYARYARKEGISLAEAKKRASKLDMEEYSRKAKRYVEEKDFSKEANDEMRLYNMTMKVNRLELLKANIGLELVDGFNDMQQFFDEKLTDRTVSEFKRQAGILGKTVTETEAAKRAKVLVNASFHNAKWSDRIWMHQDLLKGKLDSLLRTGLIQGRNPRELARELRKAFGASRSDSERLMRTEMARVQTAAQKDSFERNGFDRFEYICCGLPDACPVCRSLDGKKFSVEDMMPGENAPPMHPNCHCSTAAAAADRKDFDAWLDAKAAGETDLGFEEWNKGNDNVTKNISTKDDGVGIMNVDTGGIRNQDSLTEKQINNCIDYAVELGMPRERIAYRDTYWTGYNPDYDILLIGTDAYPNPKSQTANGRLSYKAAIAHEVIGHRETSMRGTSRDKDDPMDEAQASIRAARFSPGLLKKDRELLIQDARDRLLKIGKTLEDVIDELDVHER